MSFYHWVNGVIVIDPLCTQRPWTFYVSNGIKIIKEFSIGSVNMSLQ